MTSEKEVKRILQICNQLSAGLQEVKREEVIIRQFDNVFSTHIFHLSFLNPSSTTSNTSSLSPLPPSLVIKFYDLVVHNQLQLFSVATSHLAHFAIGQAGLGPSIYQIRPDALVMSYLEGRTLTSKDDHSVALRGRIARRLAHFHALEVPIPRNLHQERVQNIFSSRFDEKLIESLEGGQLKASLEAAGLRNILENDLSESVAFVRSSILKDDGHQIVFGHCDFNHNNILLVGEEEKVMFIDFDYSMYFYRGNSSAPMVTNCLQPFFFAHLNTQELILGATFSIVLKLNNSATMKFSPTAKCGNLLNFTEKNRRTFMAPSTWKAALIRWRPFSGKRS